MQEKLPTLVEPERRADEAEQDPGADHNEDGGVGKLVEPEEQPLLLDVQAAPRPSWPGSSPPTHSAPAISPSSFGIISSGGTSSWNRRGLVPRLETVLDASGLVAGGANGRWRLERAG